MKGLKLMLAVALFVTSVSYEEQVFVSENGLASTWEVTIGTSNAMALEYLSAANEFE